MFLKIPKTKYPPQQKPVLIWDGHCGFCKYWVTRWKNITGNSIAYRTFQDASGDFPDIPLKEFKKASRLIETDGSVYSGPDSAYRSYDYSKKNNYPYHRWYSENKTFKWISDHGYNFIAKHRPVAFKITKILFGSNPLQFKPWWLCYILGIILLFFMLFQ